MSSPVSSPTITLPKGGGAIRGMGEKFAANPVTGTGSITIPIVTSPGRSGFGPQLSLSYDSGAGNGVFGFGWNLGLPAITRKTEKGLPLYQDGIADESDVFVLSGVEDLVPAPVLVKKDNDWVPEPVTTRTVAGKVYSVKNYRPRIEGLFARIERWTNQTDPADTFWRSISKDNITTWYGKTENSRIADIDPLDSSRTRIFSWLICQSHDDKGNVISYGYQAENPDGVDIFHACERNRTNRNRSAQRYLKHIRYGNREPYFPVLAPEKPWPPLLVRNKISGSEDWFFEVIFDYGDHDQNLPEPTKLWPVRDDPFSSYRSGFEVRTYRRCQRVLMFHHFVPIDGDGEDPFSDDAKQVGVDCLVRSTDFVYSKKSAPNKPFYSFILSVSQRSYQRKAGGAGGYDDKSLPPLEFKYTEQTIDDTVREIDAQSLENIPQGLDGSKYQWVDLDGEGLSGILTEQEGAWYYKSNLSPINLMDDEHNPNRVAATFAPLELVTLKPNISMSTVAAQFMDLAGDGQIDVVEMEGPSKGFYERTDDADWDSFRPFENCPNIDTRDPNLRFVDLNGDGLSDILVTEHEVFTWYPSLGEAGFGPAKQVRKPFDDEDGPRLVFADATYSIFLADLSGDGLTDLVRITHGEVCYWPNLGYGRFGAKVTMDNSPCFDSPDLFDPRRIRLADIDGSGTTDIIYLHSKGVAVYFNQSGNSWSKPSTELPLFPTVDDLSSIQVLDLLGNGTACLVWSSPLPGYTRSPMRYIDLMGGLKPHLLVSIKNNLGAETELQYAPSTKFYLADKLAGKPWITKVPFPVHVVEKVTVTDKWRKTRFSSTYSYHHGYFDGFEREFRGFGRVEQIDVESYDKFEQDNGPSQYITDDRTLYQPPVKTITWYHTGALLDRERILTPFDDEYFPKWLDDRYHRRVKIEGGFVENALPQPDLVAENLSAEEWREALRACKGMMLRQEVYELDIKALTDPHNPAQKTVKLFSTAYHNCHIRCLQPKGGNRHAVFLVAESEAITYHYELDIREDRIERDLRQDQTATLTPDPRIAHTLNLQYDEYGNVIQSVAVVYPRIGKFEKNADLVSGIESAISLINRVQKEETHLAYSETRYTTDFGAGLDDDQIATLDNHRLRVPCEVLTYELTGIPVQPGAYLSLKDLRNIRLSLIYQSSGQEVKKLAYHELADRETPPKLEKRLVEHTRTLFFKENLRDPLPFGQHGRLGLTYEAYTLALTDTMLDAVFTDDTGKNKLNDTVDGVKTARDQLQDAKVSGYLSGSELNQRFITIPQADLKGQYWIRSGIAGFADDAKFHFFLPERYTDPFGNITTVEYDPRDLFVVSSTDMLHNKTEVTHFDFRVLAPREMRDINNNLSEVYFDRLGLPVAMAVKGKGNDADSLAAFTDELANPALTDLSKFFDQADLDEKQPQAWLKNATARHIYQFGETIENGKTVWGAHPACACGIVREQHVSQLAPDKQSPLQVAFEYSDGMGSVIVKKVQAEPEAAGKPLRWIGNGKTIFNNKGKPVKQYEPYFSPPEIGHRFEEPREVGVTPIIYYDAVGRTVRTEMPDGSYSRVEFSPWHVKTFDPNDTAFDTHLAERSDWHQRRMNPTHSKYAEFNTPENQRAAKAVQMHANTPTLTILDSLGREVISVAHNKFNDDAGVLQDLKYLTFTKLDAEGKPLWIRDARNNRVMQYISPPVPNNQIADPIKAYVPCYDIAGNLLYQHSMDAGDRWILNDAAGKPMLAWDFNERRDEAGEVIKENRLYFTEYDALHRPVANWLGINGGARQMIERFEYIDTRDGPANAAVLNLRGQLHKHYDASGLKQVEKLDFKGNLLEQHRQLASAYKAPVIDWQDGSATALLEEETFVQITEYDALNRMTRLYNWHRLMDNSRVAVYEPRYNPRGLLVGETLIVRAQKTANGYSQNAQSRKTDSIQFIEYNAKGQKERIRYGNGTTTRYFYDAETFRLQQLRTTRPEVDPKFPSAPSGLKDDKVLQNLYYTYDPVGNITEIRDDAFEPVYFRNQEVNAVNRYAYDALYRLIEASGRESAEASGPPPQIGESCKRLDFPEVIPGALRNYTQVYSYDAVGNITRIQHQTGGPGSWTRIYTYADDSNQLRTTTQGNGAQSTATYRHDPHGNMLNVANKAPGQDIHWDYRDMIHFLDLEGGGFAYYNYDAGKQRTRKRLERTDNFVEERIDLGGLELYRKYVSGNMVEEIESVHLFEGQQRILLIDDVLKTDNARLSTGPLYRYQYDNNLGSVGAELDKQARIISYEEYHPYGTTAYCALRKEVDTPKRYRYTGKERDDESGFSYHGARYYAAWLGRWVSCDPIIASNHLNMYNYCDSNPVCKVDTNGRWPIRKGADYQRKQREKAEESRARAEAQNADPEYINKKLNDQVNARILKIAEEQLVKKGFDPMTITPNERASNLDVVEVFASAMEDRELAQVSKAMGSTAALTVLDSILSATRSPFVTDLKDLNKTSIPNRQFGGALAQELGAITGVFGFRKEFRDSPIDAVNNPQLAHFMTAVAIGRFSVQLENASDNPAAGVLAKVLLNKEAEMFIKVIIGHEKIDKEDLSTIKQADLATEADVAAFRSALEALGKGIDQEIDLAKASSILSSIAIGKGPGASKEDLLASLVGYKYGQLVAKGQFKNPHDAGEWLRRNVSQSKGGIPIGEPNKELRHSG